MEIDEKRVANKRGKWKAKAVKLKPAAAHRFLVRFSNGSGLIIRWWIPVGAIEPPSGELVSTIQHPRSRAFYK